MSENPIEPPERTFFSRGALAKRLARMAHLSNLPVLKYIWLKPSAPGAEIPKPKFSSTVLPPDKKNGIRKDDGKKAGISGSAL
jgi:hypothetical protein